MDRPGNDHKVKSGKQLDQSWQGLHILNQDAPLPAAQSQLC
jgi:hypothetical protein